MSSPNGSDNRQKDKINIDSISTDDEGIVDTSHEKFFINFGIDEAQFHQAGVLARQNGTNIETELIANQFITEHIYFSHIAQQLDLIFLDDISEQNIVATTSIDILLSRNGPMRIELDGQILTVVSPSLFEFYKLKDLFRLKPELREKFAVATTTTIRNAVWRRNDLDRALKVVRRLHDTMPERSAKALLTNWQSYFLGLFTFATCLIIYLQPDNFIVALHIFLSLIYLSFNLFKLSAGFYSYSEADKQPLPAASQTLPHYTILIALYKEEQVAGQLIKAMSRLKWPKSKLDIKLICEASDAKTINALMNAKPGPEFEIVKVPDMEPRTKPKALQYALAGAKGELIAVYDAEDRPHPDQLFEAYRWFDRHDNELACMQAPLIITNADAGWLSGLFSLEYSSLFRRLIPLLAHFHLPIPLGGTSNHFRKDALLAVGGWDPCNVTEDADLGIRLYSFGYQTGVLKRPTLETAPVDVSIWLKQRTRWLKGWMQTWLVLMRHPFQLLAKRGMLSFIITQVMITGLLVAALTHPFAFLFIANTIYKGLLGGVFGIDTLEGILVYLDILNLVGIYFIFIGVGMNSLIAAQKKKIKTRWLFLVPVYWILISIAAWRAISQLPAKAQIWEKTPHEPACRQ